MALLISTLLAILAALSTLTSSVAKPELRFGPLLDLPVDNFFEAVDVSAMIADGTVSSLYRVQGALKGGVFINDVVPLLKYGRSKALTLLLVEQLINGELPVTEYGQDVFNVVRYTKESGLGLQPPKVFGTI
ncbi:uncharacterized protein [Periplaneta americana]|uniref:uncharacterized protein n=1 Tax=Periplaneta americana TaxID=6978 RepID=UPI0037E8B9DF